MTYPTMDQETYESGDAPTCRCEPGDRHPLCDLHGEVMRDWCTCRPEPTGEAPPVPEADCPRHGNGGDGYGIPVPERPDPWLTHYDPFTHGPLSGRSFR